MDELSLMRRPVERELAQYRTLFKEALAHENDLLGSALGYVCRREGKMMRPLLVLLSAREYGAVGSDSLHAAVTLELLHTASLVHDDVVDESKQRRAQRSVNAVFDNRVAVLVGDYLLSVALIESARAERIDVVKIVSQLGATLSRGEIDQIQNTQTEVISEENYFKVIRSKTASLFSACSRLGALTAGAPEEDVERAARFGEIVGLCFQIRDDIFDYFPQAEIGKPTYNDMAEGKLTLPAIHAVLTAGDGDIRALAQHVKTGHAGHEEIERLVDFTKRNGGIDYAREVMMRLHDEALGLLASYCNEEVKNALRCYIDYVVGRNI